MEILKVEDTRISIALDVSARIWIHRGIGRENYIQYVLPQNQTPIVKSGTLHGPFGKREFHNFVLGLKKEFEYGRGTIK